MSYDCQCIDGRINGCLSLDIETWGQRGASWDPMKRNAMEFVRRAGSIPKKRPPGGLV